jgi:Citrate lyase beta subunit
MKHPGFRFFFITNVPSLASFVWSNGVDRLFVDLEFNGKVARQGHLSTVISQHSFEDLLAVRRAVPAAEVMARLNPLHAGTKAEVDEAAAIGADVLMLPMFRSAEELREFCSIVDGRCRICPLVETVGAMEDIAAIADLPEISELHIGLNDLHLELGDAFIFEPLASGKVDRMAAVLREAGVRFGFGGVARAGEGLLPAELILAEHVRLGSDAAILSRTFHREADSPDALLAEMDFAAEIGKLRQAYEAHKARSPGELDAIHAEVQDRVRAIVATRRAAATGGKEDMSRGR